MFANLTYEDKQAFFSLLDEYFESRPHLLSGGGAGGTAARPGAPPTPVSRGAGAAPVTSPLAGGASSPGLRSGPPPVSAASRPPSNNRPPPAGPPVHPSAGAHVSSGVDSPPRNLPGGTYGQTMHQPGSGGAFGQAKGFMNTGLKHGTSGINKLGSNSHVSGALGKVGAGNLANKMTYMSVPGASTKKPAGVGRTNSGASTPPAPAYEARPSAPAAHNANQAQALYDYAGGDDTDLPVSSGQVITIVAKTSDDWWTCEDETGKQGLVPANYLQVM